MSEDTSYLFTEYGRRKEYEGYEMEMKDNESFNFKDYIYDRLNKAMTLTTDLDYPAGLLFYNDTLVKILDDIKETVENAEMSKRADRIKNDLLMRLERLTR